MAKMTEITWNEFEALPLEAKRPYLANPDLPNTPYHTLFAVFVGFLCHSLDYLSSGFAPRSLSFMEMTRETPFSCWLTP